MRDERGYLSDGVFAAVAIAVAVVCVALMVVGARAFQREQCEQRVEAMGREWRYGLLSGCLARVSDGTYVPLENFRTTTEDAP